MLFADAMLGILALFAGRRRQAVINAPRRNRRGRRPSENHVSANRKGSSPNRRVSISEGPWDCQRLSTLRSMDVLTP